MLIYNYINVTIKIRENNEKKHMIQEEIFQTDILPAHIYIVS